MGPHGALRAYAGLYLLRFLAASISICRLVWDASYTRIYFTF